MRTLLTVAAITGLTLLIGGVVFLDEVKTFLNSMQPGRLEATITFGKALDSTGRSILNPTSVFQIEDNVAWVVSFNQGIKTKELVVALFEVAPDSSEIPLGKNKMKVEPTDQGVYNLAPAQVFWSLSPKGINLDHHTYRVKYLKDRVVVQGDFMIELPANKP
jgi:hypothetical protein